MYRAFLDRLDIQQHLAIVDRYGCERPEVLGKLLDFTTVQNLLLIARDAAVGQSPQKFLGESNLLRFAFHAAIGKFLDPIEQ